MVRLTPGVQSRGSCRFDRVQSCTGVQQLELCPNMSEEIEGLHEEIQDVCKEVEEGLRREDSQLARFGSLALLLSCSELLPDVECPVPSCFRMLSVEKTPCLTLPRTRYGAR